MANPSKFSRRLARLAAMDREELFDRARQFLTARADVLRFRDARTFEETDAVSFAPAGHFFFAPADVPLLSAELKKEFPAQAGEIIQRAERICQHRFDLLGYENLDYGAEIDWQLDIVHGKRGPRKPWFKVKYLDLEEVGDAKITWELNRHQHFVTLAKAYALAGNDKFAHEIFTQWKNWHKENPYPIGMNWASSLEVAFRSLSWIWTFFLLSESPLFTKALRKQWLGALNLSGRHIETYLSTYFSPNTHLLGEALALFFLGTVFPGFESAARWKRLGWEILEREAARQVREDGFYFEQSTYYHVYAVDMFLHARILAGLNGVEIPQAFDQILQRMLNALCLLGRAGITPSLGDDDGGRLFDPRRNRAEHMLDPLATGAVLYRRPDFKFGAGAPSEETLWLLGVKGLAEFVSMPAARPAAASTALIASGLYFMADESSGQQVLIDAGTLGAGSGGHGHADALSVCLSRNGRNLLIDPGTFEYVGESGERARLRGTSAHNTMKVDGCDQAESAGPFSWKSFPRVTVEQWITGKTFDLFQGSHDGYARLESAVIHRRSVFYRKGEFCFVRDLAEGRGSHQLDIAWHVDPTLSREPSEQFRFGAGCENLALLPLDDLRWSQSVREDDCAPIYGRRERAGTVDFSAMVDLPADFATLLISGESLPQHIGQLIRIDETRRRTVCGYRYTNSRQEHNFFFASAAPWSLGVWESDADFLYWSFDRDKKQYALILCNGTFVAAAGRRVLNCSKRVRYAEVLSSNSNVEILSSDPERVDLEQPLDRALSGQEVVTRGNDPQGMGL